MNKQPQKAAQFLGDLLDIFRNEYRRRDGIQRAGNTFEFGDHGGVDSAWKHSVRADVALGEILLGKASQADAELSGLGAQSRVLGWCHAHGHNVRARGLLIGPWPCHLRLLMLLGSGRHAP